jgi:hypothetical protein
MLGAEQLTADRAGEKVLAGIGSKEGGEDGKRATRIERDGGASLGARSWELGTEV